MINSIGNIYFNSVDYYFFDIHDPSVYPEWIGWNDYD